VAIGQNPDRVWGVDQFRVSTNSSFLTAPIRPNVIVRHDERIAGLAEMADTPRNGRRVERFDKSVVEPGVDHAPHMLFAGGITGGNRDGERIIAALSLPDIA
jgi:hypothetical protein